MSQAGFRWLICSLGLMVIGNVQAQDVERKTFRQLYHKALNGQHSAVQEAQQKLANYPITHYIEYAWIRSQMSKLPEQAINDFKQKHPNSPLNKRLKSQFLRALGQQQKWQQYLSHHQGLDQGVKQCWYLRARLATGQTQGLPALAQAMWLSGLSAPAACDPVFNWWQKQGHRTDELILQRIELAFEQHNFSLAGYLKSQLKAPPAWVTHAIDLMKNPEPTLRQASGWTSDPKVRGLIHKTAMRLAKKQPAMMHTLWPSLKSAHAFTSHQAMQVERQIALFAATDYEPFSIGAMSQLPSAMKDDQIRAWMVRYHLYHEDWQAVFDTLNTMPSRQLTQNRWQYWLGRAQAKLGQKTAAKATFGKLAAKSNYYGFLAADHLREPYALCASHPVASNPNFKPNGGIQRAIELHHAGLLTMARSEWNLAYRGLSPADKVALAELVQQENWYAKAIAIMADLGHWNSYELRYPIAHEALIKQHANSLQPMPQWVMAIIKQESAWTKDAVSHADAHGLMQLLPATAKRLSTQLGLSFQNKRQLHQPPLNIQLGVQYQKNLFKQFNHPILVAAAYNAGEGKSIDWSVGFPRSPDVWLETIPYRETRDYITKILSNVTIYDWLINGKPQRITSWMPTMPIGQTTPKQWPNVVVSTQRAPVLCAP